MKSAAVKRSPKKKSISPAKKCKTDQSEDPFDQHFNRDIPEDFAGFSKAESGEVAKTVQFEQFGKDVSAQFTPMAPFASSFTAADESQLSENIIRKPLRKNSKEHLTESAFSRHFFSMLQSYRDVYYPLRTFETAEDIRFAYSLHALNHIIKTRTAIIDNNAKLLESNQMADCRDQGLSRPKVLILVPFKDSALKVVKNFISLLFGTGDRELVTNKKRFFDEFSGEEVPTRHVVRPDHFDQLFAGNVDDCFRVGVGVARKSLKLYVDFYSADILIASPLGLKMIVGVEGDKEFDRDFLSSIEVVIVDQADVFLMQNWAHVSHILENLNCVPKEPHGADFSRIRMWSLNGQSPFYRQTLLFTHVAAAEFNAIFNRFSKNWAGRLTFKPSLESGSLVGIVAQVPQVFQRFSCGSHTEMEDRRFGFFVEKLLPKCRNAGLGYTLIYIPSYFDFVRLRNHFKREELSFVQVCEYTSVDKVSRARDMFYHGRKSVMLFTERYHFFHRYQIRGIRQLIFYQLPTYPEFYTEMSNMLALPSESDEGNDQVGSTADLSCTVVYCQYDAIRLAGVVGEKRAAQLLGSVDKSVHVLVTGD